MVIKYQDNFYSVFYAVLYSNLTGHFAYSQNEPVNLFVNENTINIDNLNWQEIIEQHSLRYGSLSWLNEDNIDLVLFKSRIEDVFMQKDLNKYQLIIQAVKLAIKFGPAYANKHILKTRQKKLNLKLKRVKRGNSKQKILSFNKI
ncbi:hypothetical protein ACFL2U_03450 [Patescibacteria group bacterium]